MAVSRVAVLFYPPTEAPRQGRL